MNENALYGTVLRIVLAELAKTGERFTPVMSSNRHIHLSQADVERLFGVGYQLTRLRDLEQPGQFACRETVIMQGEKGKTALRVVGPARKETQIELSHTDCYTLGIPPMLRMSGNTQGTPGCMLHNGERSLSVSHGVIVAARHLHLSLAEATAYGLKDGDTVALQVEGARACVLQNLAVRCGREHRLEAHIDKDEANACGLADGQLCRILRSTGATPPTVLAASSDMIRTIAPEATAPPREALALPVAAAMATIPHTYVPQKQLECKTTMLDLSHEPRCLLTEADVRTAVREGHRLIRLNGDAIVTPLARDAAAANGIELIPLT